MSGTVEALLTKPHLLSRARIEWSPICSYLFHRFHERQWYTRPGFAVPTGYAQKFYLKGYHRAPLVVQETRQQSNAKGTPFFNSQTIAEKFIMDWEPVPDYLAAVLNALQNHSSITLYDTMTGQSESIATGRPTFEFTPVEADVILKGTFSYETNRAFVACEDNMEVCSWFWFMFFGF